jgi:hypothetical protein
MTPRCVTKTPTSAVRPLAEARNQPAPPSYTAKTELAAVWGDT